MINLGGFKQFIRNQMGISTQYLPDNSPDIVTAYELSKDQVNLFFARFCNVYPLMVYNLAAHILIEIAQDYSVPITTSVWSANIATSTASVATNFISGNTVVISNAVPTAYNITTQITVIDSTHFTYPLTPNPGSILIPGNVGFNLFETLRANWHINNFVGGVIASSADESTSESLAVPDALKQATLNDLGLLKTSYGRWYLSYAQKFGSVWGIS